MTIVGHLAGGFLVARQLANRMSLSKSDQMALRVLGTLAAALPDLDFLIYLARARSFELGSDFQHHKWITHTFPFYVFPGVIVYLYTLLTGKEKLRQGTVMMTACACVHLIQDMIGTVDGIMWAWPFSRRMDGICLVGNHGPEWLDAYGRHPIAWVERIINIAASLTLISELFKWGRSAVRGRFRVW